MNNERREKLEKILYDGYGADYPDITDQIEALFEGWTVTLLKKALRDASGDVFKNADGTYKEKVLEFYTKEWFKENNIESPKP